MKKIEIQTQPNDFSCGPTCLHAVYKYLGERISLDQVISEVHSLRNGGTLSVMLAIDALKKGYKATIYHYNLELFDPTWFPITDRSAFIDKLKQQIKAKPIQKLVDASLAYIKFLELGGMIRFRDLTPKLLDNLFQQGYPILTGLSATYLYQCSREVTISDGVMEYNDVKGEATGHFVILSGYNKSKNYVLVADPFKANPVSGTNYYSINTRRVINSILLSIITYDANLLVIQPKKSFK
ncbi:MAG: C39 family peptidase [Vicingaceae bacterium]